MALALRDYLAISTGPLLNRLVTRLMRKYGISQQALWLHGIKTHSFEFVQSALLLVYPLQLLPRLLLNQLVQRVVQHSVLSQSFV
jgi:hypothetical protein